MCVNCHLHHEFDIMESIDRLPQLQDRLVLTLHRPTWQYQLVLSQCDPTSLLPIIKATRRNIIGELFMLSVVAGVTSQQLELSLGEPEDGPDTKY